MQNQRHGNAKRHANAQRGSANQHADYDINPAECHGRGLPPARNRDWRHHNGKRYVGALRRFGLNAAVPHRRAILGRLHRGPISRGRILMQIGAPSALAATDVMNKPSLQAVNGK
jgi:hypothetical protein